MIARALVAAVVAALLLPAAASAHALLEGTVPARGAALRTQPDEVAFRFSEPVESAFGSVRVFDSSGEEVQSGEVLRPRGDSSAVGIGLEPDLPDGTYTATYRVVSADSHPISGGIVFTIGDPGESGAPLAELLESQGETGGTSSPGFVAARWVGYAATAVAVGGLVFLLVAGGPALRRSGAGQDRLAAARAAFARRARSVLLLAAGAGLVAALLSLPLQIAAAADVSFLDAFSRDHLSAVLDTRYGAVQAIRAAAFAMLGLGACLAIRREGCVSPAPALGLCGPAAAFLLVAPALAGHASTQEPTAVLLPADVVHVAAMTAWLGGLAALLLVVPAATRRLEGRERADLLGGALTRFSPVALACVIALAVTGVVQAVIELGAFADLLHTGFGRAILVKAELLLLLAVAGYVNRSQLMPAIARAGERLGTAGRRVRLNLRLEVAGIALVLVASSIMVGYAPPAATGGGPVSGTENLGDQYLEYTVDPATIGPNELHLYLFDAADGTQVEPKELTASASLPSEDVGPLDIDLRKAGPGHYVAADAAFGIGGEWTLDVAVRTSRFEQAEAEIGIPIE